MHRHAVDGEDGIAIAQIPPPRQACPAALRRPRGAPRSIFSPSSPRKLPSQSAGESPASASTRVAWVPSGRSTSRVACSLPEVRSRRQRRSCHERTGVPSTAVTSSPALNAGDRRGRPRRRRGQYRALPGDAHHVRAGEEQHREQQVGDRPGGDDGDALPDALPIEGARQVGRSHLALALVGHLDVAAERQRGERPFGAIAADAARPDDTAEADREAQHLDAGELGDDVVAELVERDQHAERDDEGENLLCDIDHADTACLPSSSFGQRAPGAVGLERVVERRHRVRRQARERLARTRRRYRGSRCRGREMPRPRLRSRH